jgi:hypothetical protein
MQRQIENTDFRQLGAKTDRVVFQSYQIGDIIPPGTDNSSESAMDSAESTVKISCPRWF